MPRYRYYTKTLIGDSYLSEVELYGVTASRNLSAAGEFNGTFMLKKDSPLLNSMLLDATAPAKTALYMERDDELIWGGILWSRTYESTGQTMQLYAQTFESYFDHMVFYVDHFIQQSVDQAQILANALTQLQSQPNSSIGLTVASVPTTGVVRTVLIPNYEFHFGTDAVSPLVGVDLGLEYTIGPDKVMHIGYPQLGSTTPEKYDYPGNITNYYMPESGSSGGVRFATLGAGSGNNILRATSENPTLLGDGYPGWWLVKQYSDIGTQAAITAKNASDAAVYPTPYRTPTFVLKSDEGVGFTSWNDIGASFGVHIEDVRYPSGYDISSRMIGWTLTPAAGETPETLQFAIQGSDV